MDAVTTLVRQNQTQDLFFTFKSDGLPEAGLTVREFTMSEEVFVPFTLEIELSSEKADLDLTQMMDKPAVIAVHDRYREKKRYFHGVVAEAACGESGRRHTFYHLTLMPALHRLRFTSDSRIFQNQSVPQIIETLLKENNVTDYRFELSGSRSPREFCVQYRETDLDYIERLMAEEGIHYYHEHREDGHTLVISDTSMETKIVDDGEIEYNSLSGGDVKGPYIRKFLWREEVRPTKVALKDYTFKQPKAPLLEQAVHQNPPGHAQEYEIYDFPGRHKQDDAGAKFAQWRLEGLRCETSLGRGEGYCAQLQAGRAFKLKEHGNEKLNREYFLVEARHHGIQPGATEEDAGEASNELGTQLNTTFRAIPISTPWRPQQRTKPVVDGPQMAHVVGPAGEEIYCDEHGRVKLQFQWDRYGKSNDTSSCWIRVMQAWAGPMFGNIAIPRIGQEVMVEFLEGDPDQPVIAGRAYHASNLTPYKLPDNKTRMSIKSKTHKGDGFNEMRFEDEKGQEELYIHAEKDISLRVKNNSVERISGQHLSQIEKDVQKYIGLSSHLSVGKSYSISVGFDSVRNSPLSFYQLKDDNLQSILSKTSSFDFHKGTSADYRVSVKGSIYMDTQSTYILRARDDLSLNSGKDLMLRGETGVEITSNASGEMTALKGLSISSGKYLKLGVNGAYILISEDGGIRIHGKFLEIVADAKAGISAGTSLDVKSSASMTLKSAKININ